MLGCTPKPSGGDLSAEQMSVVVAREQPALASCYQAGLDRSPYEHEFRVQAVLQIRPDGSVANVDLDQTGLSGLGACVKKSIRGWQFPKAAAETRASLPIVFKPKIEKAKPGNFKLPPGFQVLDDEPKPVE
jgi:hypothetical protein